MREIQQHPLHQPFFVSPLLAFGQRSIMMEKRSESENKIVSVAEKGRSSHGSCNRFADSIPRTVTSLQSLSTESECERLSYTAVLLRQSEEDGKSQSV